MDKILTVIGAIVTVVVLAFILSFIFALPVKWLWNSTMPELFSLKPIDWWMAWKLSLLCSFLFKSTNFNHKS